MKHKLLNKLIAACMISVTLCAAAPTGASAAWVDNYYGGWAYSTGYGLLAGWNKIDNVWYYFDSYGRMQTGWVPDGGKWYYLNASGAMQTGVIQVEGKTYLFSEHGDMQTGPAVIGGKFYNFADNGMCIGNDIPTPAKAYDYYGLSTIPYLPNQIMNSNTTMSNEIPTESGTTVEYKVVYKDDDGDTLSTRRIEENKKITLYTPVKDGYDFVEWNTKKNGNGTSYDAEEVVKVTKDMTLYAQWDEVDEDKDKDED